MLCSDKNWRKVSTEVKERIGYNKREDGEFWMLFTDFWAEFYDVTICNLTPDLDRDGHTDDEINTV